MMTETPRTFAALLHGREIGEEITEEECKIAKANGLVVVFGYSDDCCEFRGAFDDEIGCYDGGEIPLFQSGVIAPECDNDLCPHEFAIRKKAMILKAYWCKDESSPAWTYEIPVYHETFDVLENGVVWCRGIVFHKDALPEPPRKEGK